MGALRFDGVNDVVSIVTAMTGNAGTSLYTMRVKSGPAGVTLPSTGLAAFIGTSSNSNITGLITNSAGRVMIYTGATLRYGSTNGLIQSGVPFDFTLTHNADGTWNFYDNINSVTNSTGTFVTSTTFGNLNQFGRGNNTTSTYLQGDIQFIEVTGLANAQKWDSDLSAGVGNEWLTTSGSNNGTLNNFPTDNSQWIGFGGGGTAQNITVSNAETLQQAQQAVISTTQAIAVSNAQTLQQAEPAAISTTQTITVSNAETLQQAQPSNVGVSQAITVSIAQQLTEAQQVTISQGGAAPGQDIVVLNAEQRTEAASVTVTTNQGIAAGNAETLQQAQQVAISTAQQVLANNAQQLTEAQQVTISQGALPPAQDIVVLNAEQRTEAVAATIGMGQGIAVAAAQQIAEAASVTVTTGQGVISTDAEQVTQAEPAVVSLIQQIMVSVAQQLTQGQIAGEVPAQPIIAAKVKVTLKPARFTISIVN